MPTPMTFRQWKENHKDLNFQKCFKCDGTGCHKCDCGDTHDCGNCEGEGKFLDGETLRQAYENQLLKDEQLAKKWGKA